jgi:hypothetical protein
MRKLSATDLYAAMSSSRGVNAGIDLALEGYCVIAKSRICNGDSVCWRSPPDLFRAYEGYMVPSLQGFVSGLTCTAVVAAWSILGGVFSIAALGHGLIQCHLKELSIILLFLTHDWGEQHWTHDEGRA